MNRSRKYKRSGDKARVQLLLHILSHVLVLLWMYVIYGFSAQNGESSGGLSEKICLAIVNFVNDVLNMGWNELKLAELAAVMGYPVRKLAHMTEFGILAMLFYWALGFYPRMQKAEGAVAIPYGSEKSRIQLTKGYTVHRSGRIRYVLAFILTVCYAALDEFHQLFIPDRSGNVFDVCVDTTGALLALVFVWGVSLIVDRIKDR